MTEASTFPDASPSTSSCHKPKQSRAILIGVLIVAIVLLIIVIMKGGLGKNPPMSTFFEGFCPAINGIKATSVSQYGGVQCDKAYSGKPIIVKGESYQFGIGTHAPSVIQFDLGGKNFRSFDAIVALPDYTKGTLASVEFQVFGDNKLLWKSDVITGGQSKPVSVNISGVSKLELKVGEGPNSNYFDHAMWVNPVFY